LKASYIKLTGEKMRKVLEQSKLAASALSAIENFHPDYVKEVEAAIGSNAYVIVGMRQNPVVRKARKLLSENNIAFKYIEHGSYFSGWKPRLAIKLWSGWPTFPMVFVDGKLIGGCKELQAYLVDKKN
jgi:monothiol glutaredoxin